MKSRSEIAQEEVTRDPIFLFRVRRVYPNQDCIAVRNSDMEYYIDPVMKIHLDDDDLLRREWAFETWDAITVFLTREEGEDFGDRTSYRYGKGRKNIDWQVYCVPCEGELAKLLSGEAKTEPHTPSVNPGDLVDEWDPLHNKPR